MVEVFRTTIVSGQVAKIVLKQLKIAFPNSKINFDLEDCDNILRFQTNMDSIDIDSMIEIIRNLGYEAEVLPDEIPNQKIKLAESNPIAYRCEMN